MKVSVCRLCPFQQVVHCKDEYFCDFNSPYKTIEDVNTIPDWCPLPDLPETKKP